MMTRKKKKKAQNPLFANYKYDLWNGSSWRKGELLVPIQFIGNLQLAIVITTLRQPPLSLYSHDKIAAMNPRLIYSRIYLCLKKKTKNTFWNSSNYTRNDDALW